MAGIGKGRAFEGFDRTEEMPIAAFPPISSTHPLVRETTVVLCSS